MTYERFASWYDQLMSDAPYDQWCALVERAVSSYQTGKRMLDLGCGTGELALRLAEKGFDVTGVDVSEQMLAIAQMKAQERGVDLSFFSKICAILVRLSRLIRSSFLRFTQLFIAGRRCGRYVFVRI